MCAFVAASALADKASRKPNEFKPGSKCGLADTWGEGIDDGDVAVSFDLDAKSLDEAKATKSLERKVKILPKIVKEQLIAGASSFGTPVTDAFKAALLIRQGSEGAELSILKATIKGKKYSIISYYGGGNHTGFIFAWGSKKILAEIGDDDISCL